ncbi:MAG: HNH endonuclease signature motif containing protein, partial [Nitrososphaeraceae archaeon]
MTSLTTMQQYIFEETRTYIPQLLRIDYRQDHEFITHEEWNNISNGRLKIEMIREQGPFCARCNKWNDIRDLTIDHRYTEWMGYSKQYYQTLENRQLMCRRCHKLKVVMENAFRNRVGG